MRVPGKRVIAHARAASDRSTAKATNGEGLPKLRRFEPEEKSKETAARSSKRRESRAAGIVTQAANLAVR